MNQFFEVKWVSTEYLDSVAEKFLAEHNPSNLIPVPIDYIVEIDLKIDIIPIPGLKDNFEDAGLDIDAFISSDLKSITVDQYVMEKVKNRYRFTIAHEIAHLLLHRNIYQGYNFSNIDEWTSFILALQNNLSQRGARDRAEWQAGELAGRILVPKSTLENEFDKERNSFIKMYSRDHPTFEIFTDYTDYMSFITDLTIHSLAQQFIVSDHVIRIRLENDNLIERQR